jgi:hypothetical protein
MISPPLHSQLAQSHVEDLHRDALVARRRQVLARHDLDHVHGALRTWSTLVQRSVGRRVESGRQAREAAASVRGSELVAR